MSEELVSTECQEPVLLCDGPPIGGDLRKVAEMMTHVAGDACFYGCFVASLYSSATTRYAGIQEALASALNGVITLGKIMLRQPLLWAGESKDYLENLINDFVSFASGTVNQISAAAKGKSFADIMWVMLKTMVCRYAETILLAAVQALVNKMQTDLHNRTIILGNIRNLLSTLEGDINDLSETDWWREFVKAVVAADLNLRVAEQETYRAHTNAAYGRWDNSQLEMVQWRILTAIQKLAPRGLVGDLLDMFTSFMKDHAFDPLDPAFFRTKLSQTLDSIDRLGDTLTDLKKWYDCLLKTTVRLQYYKELIVHAEGALQFLQSNQYTGLALDVLLSDNTLWFVGTRIGDIRADMRDVVENNRRSSAPIHSAAWRNELQGLFMMLKTLGQLPQPFGVSSYATNQEATSDLAYIIHPHTPDDGLKSLSEVNYSVSEIQQILSRLMATTADLSSFFLRHDQWAFELNRIKTDVNAISNRDAQMENMLNRFSGYEDEKYDYVITWLANAGWSAPLKMLESGFIPGFLEMTIESVVAGSTVAQCLSGVLSNMGEDEIAPGESKGIRRQVEQLYQDEAGASLARARSATMLPALQFQALAGLQKRLDELQGNINTALEIAERVC